MINKYAGKCEFCSGVVKKGCGTVYKIGYSWKVAHHDCKWGNVRTLNLMADFDARDHSSYEDRCCGDSAYEDRCAQMTGCDREY